MVRQLRVEYEGAIHHVVSRGDRREPIFEDDEDRLRFLRALGEACERADWEVLAYCLMGRGSGESVAGMGTEEEDHDDDGVDREGVERWRPSNTLESVVGTWSEKR